MAEAAKRGVATCMELGGKSCLIVFDDVNIDNAVEWAMVSTLAFVMLQLSVCLKCSGLSAAHKVLISLPHRGQIACRMHSTRPALASWQLLTKGHVPHSLDASGPMDRSAVRPRGC